MTNFTTEIMETLINKGDLAPRPGAFLINHMFSNTVQITDQKTFNQAEKNVAKKTDLTYESNYKENTYDIYYPKNSKGPVPVLFWVHGGGFVGGDKSGVKEFATKLVSDANIAVVAMNYELASDSEYPNQVLQVNELVKDLLAEGDDKLLDMEQLFFGGDSAGAQITLQYAALQTNEAYAKQMKIKQVLPKDSLKGTISYCGPVDLKLTAQQHSDDRFMKFFVKTVAWSLIGTKDWKTKQLEIVIQEGYILLIRHGNIAAIDVYYHCYLRYSTKYQILLYLLEYG
ncbi:alpha/beta hydrolase [Listeria innocua]